MRFEVAGLRYVSFDDISDAIRGESTEQQHGTVGQRDGTMADACLHKHCRLRESASGRIKEYRVFGDTFLAPIRVATTGDQHASIRQARGRMRCARRRHGIGSHNAKCRFR